jgi:hypothetical protein
MPEPWIPNTQTIGNIGLFYVCYQLSDHGWNVMPTTRNTPGIDILVYSQDGSRKWTVQVKARSKDVAIDLGDRLDFLFDYLVVCRISTRDPHPKCSVLSNKDVRQMARCFTKKNGKVSFWLRAREYGSDQFLEKWDSIGSGLSEAPEPVPYIPPRPEPL